MAVNTSPIFPLSLDTDAVTFVNADGTSEKTLLTAGVEGERIDVISATSDDTSDRVFALFLNDGTTSYRIGEITVLANAGTDGIVKAKKVLNSTDLPWLDVSGSLFLKGGWKLNIAAKVAVTAAKTVTFVASSGAY